MKEELLTIDELADVLKVKKIVYLFSHEGKRVKDVCPESSLEKKYLRFRYQDVMDWIEKPKQGGQLRVKIMHRSGPQGG